MVGAEACMFDCIETGWGSPTGVFYGVNMAWLIGLKILFYQDQFKKPIAIVIELILFQILPTTHHIDYTHPPWQVVIKLDKNKN